MSGKNGRLGEFELSEIIKQNKNIIYECSVKRTTLLGHEEGRREKLQIIGVNNTFNKIIRNETFPPNL